MLRDVLFYCIPYGLIRIRYMHADYFIATLPDNQIKIIDI